MKAFAGDSAGGPPLDPISDDNRSSTADEARRGGIAGVLLCEFGAEPRIFFKKCFNIRLS